MKLHYYPETDSLDIEFRPAPTLDFSRLDTIALPVLTSKVA